MLAVGSLAFNTTGGNNVILFFNQTASGRWATHTESEGCCFARSDAFTGGIQNVQPLAN